MRRVFRNEQDRVCVSDDSDRVLQTMLEFALSEAVGNEMSLEQRFAPDGPGLGIPDTLSVTRVRDVYDLPVHLAEDPNIDVYKNELWLVGIDVPNPKQGIGHVASLVVDGDELRDLVAQAQRLWTRPIGERG